MKITDFSGLMCIFVISGGTVTRAVGQTGRRGRIIMIDARAYTETSNYEVVGTKASIQVRESGPLGAVRQISARLVSNGDGDTQALSDWTDMTPCGTVAAALSCANADKAFDKATARGQWSKAQARLEAISKKLAETTPSDACQISWSIMRHIASVVRLQTALTRYDSTDSAIIKAFNDAIDDLNSGRPAMVCDNCAWIHGLR